MARKEKPVERVHEDFVSNDKEWAHVGGAGGPSIGRRGSDSFFSSIAPWQSHSS